MSPRWKASVAVVAQLMIWAGTVGLVYTAIPELVLFDAVDNRNNRMTDNNGNTLSVGVDLDSEKARDHYDFWATVCLLPMTVGMGLQIIEPIVTLTKR